MNRDNNRLLLRHWQFFLIPYRIKIPQNVMHYLLLGAVLPEFIKYLEIYVFSTFQ
jgi:hypothetical protein